MVAEKMSANFAANVTGWTIFALTALCLWLCVGCESKSSDGRDATSGASTDEASEKGATVSATAKGGFDYLKARREFAEADFFKPAADSADEDTIRMAPLIVREVAGADVGQWRLGVDFSELQEPDPATADASQERIVYYSRDEVVIGGWAHQRLSYVWLLRHRERGELQWCGVRMVRGLDGRPIISEVFASDATAREFFIAQAVEDQAWIEFGKPLPQRRYAVEVALEDAPTTFVTRVISDGREPMGPFVYMEANGRSVTTLLCRCMSSQYKAVRKNEYYQLQSLDDDGVDLMRSAAPELAALLNGASDALPLVAVLRIPKLQ